MFIFASCILMVFLLISFITRRPFFLLLLPLIPMFSLYTIISSSPNRRAPSAYPDDYPCCRVSEPPQTRDIHLQVPIESSMDATVTSGNNSVTLENL